MACAVQSNFFFRVKELILSLFDNSVALILLFSYLVMKRTGYAVSNLHEERLFSYTLPQAKVLLLLKVASYVYLTRASLIYH